MYDDEIASEKDALQNRVGDALGVFDFRGEADRTARGGNLCWVRWCETWYGGREVVYVDMVWA